MTNKLRMPIAMSTGFAVLEAAAPNKIMDITAIRKNLRDIDFLLSHIYWVGDEKPASLTQARNDQISHLYI